MTDIVERLGVLAASLANPQVAVDAQRELERLRIRCDGYQASRDWAINQLSTALHIEADTVHAVEFYARLAAEEIERLRAMLREVYKKACTGEIRFNDPARLEGGIYTFWDRINAALGDEP